MWYCVVLTGGATDGKHYKRTVARKHSTRGRLQDTVARDEAADGIHGSASQRLAEKHDGRAKDNPREVRRLLERICEPCRRSDVHLRIQARHENRN